MVSAILANPDAWRLQGSERFTDAALEIRRASSA
jgi:hypothetical protein